MPGSEKALFRLELVRFTGEASVNPGDWNGLMRAVGKHLMSRGYEILDDGTVIAGVVHSAGRVVPLNGHAQEMLPLAASAPAPLLEGAEPEGGKP